MRIHIGPHTRWFGPFQLAEKILFWKDKYKDDSVHELGDRLTKIKPLNNFLNWMYKKRNRKIEVHVDGYDVWNADHTLALIIVPVLKKLKEQKQGSPHVDDRDVPANLRRSAAPPLTKEEKNTGHTDELWEARWNWVLDEMIWTFEQHADPDWEYQYHSGDTDWVLDKVEESGLTELKHGPNHTFKVDDKGMKRHRARMSNGRRLFAKYYESLWD
jgi:hypothetical protein